MSYAILLVFLVQTVAPARAELVLSPPGQMVALSPAFNPPVLKGIKVHPDNPLRFDFILDKGDDTATDEQIKTDSTRLIKYFLASLTIPEKDLWVNLSPYEKDRIVPEAFGLTEMGRDLLAQDYLLKQISALLLYPEGETGTKFWKKIYAMAHERYGTTDIPVDIFNKVWIVPEKAVVFENSKSAVAYVAESRLKVMMETDYRVEDTARRASPAEGAVRSGMAINHKGASADSGIELAVLREVVIPALEKEVNEGQNFARLRQAYQSLILALWYKKRIRQSLLAAVYVDHKKTNGINIADPKEFEKIWGQYVAAFNQGAFNLIKEHSNPATNEKITCKYFSGGFDFDVLDAAMQITSDPDVLSIPRDASRLRFLDVRAVPAQEKMQGERSVPRSFYSMDDFIARYVYSYEGQPVMLKTAIGAEMPKAFNVMANLWILRYEMDKNGMKEVPLVVWQNMRLGELYPFFGKELQEKFGVVEMSGAEYRQLTNRFGQLPEHVVSSRYVLIKEKVPSSFPGEGSRYAGYDEQEWDPSLELGVVKEIERFAQRLQAPIVGVDCSTKNLSGAQSLVFHARNTFKTIVYSEQKNKTIMELADILRGGRSPIVLLNAAKGSFGAGGTKFFDDNDLFLELDGKERVIIAGEDLSFYQAFRRAFDHILVQQIDAVLIEAGVNPARNEMLAIAEPEIRGNDPMSLNPGGINLGAAEMKLNTGTLGDNSNFHLDPAQIGRVHNATGFVPVIIKVQAVADLAHFLGLQQLSR